MNIKKIAIFLPNTSPFYVSTFFAMKRGFEELGIEVGGWAQLLDQEPLLEFCRQFKPDALIEMNRSRAQIPKLPKEIIHIGWIVDLLGHSFDYFCQSEILYFFITSWVELYKECWEKKYGASPPCLLKWLPPGFCPATYFTRPQKPAFDFSFIGHIPLPWTQAELERPMQTPRGISMLTFGKFYKTLEENPEQVTELFRSGTRAEHFLSKLAGEQIEIKDRILNYDIIFRTARMLNRSTMMKIISTISNSIAIYGPENWSQWPEFKPFYKNFLFDPNRIRDVYLSTRLNIHEGSGIHFRTFDCMGAGGFLFFHENKHRKSPTKDMEYFFEAGKHYAVFDETSIKDQATYYLKNKEIRIKIASNAQKIVRAEHKWSDRAQKILSDLQIF